MSKWLKKEEYEMFAGNKAKEAEQAQDDTVGGFYQKWKNPTMGTQEKANEYKVRLLPDPVSGFYKKYMYHGFMSGEKFKYMLCPKTHGLDKYCAFCEATKILYQGNESDKRKAKDYKRKDRYVSNVFIVDDPRDATVKDEKYKVNGTVRLYEFPATVESKISNEVTDTEQGYGLSIFDPEEGFDFILKIKAKPKDNNGKEWPDYGDTIFARRANAIGEGAALDAIMESRVDLDKYIDSMALPVDELEKLLKAEMLWDDVGASFERNYHRSTPPTQAEATPETPARQEATQEATPTPEATQQATPEPEGDDTDALLAELQDM